MTGVKEGEEGVLTCLAPFSEPEWAWGLIQVLTLMALYGYVLFYSSNMLSEGSELLLLVPSLAGIVGSVVLPILGAVPDGAIMLFSGLGPNAQEELTVGIGAIAGSTVMLLTIPWGLSIIMGRVPLRSDGTANYKKKGHVSGASFLTGYGVMPETSIRSNALIMVVTSLIYLIIQGPAFAYATDTRYARGASQQGRARASPRARTPPPGRRAGHVRARRHEKTRAEAQATIAHVLPPPRTCRRRHRRRRAVHSDGLGSPAALRTFALGPPALPPILACRCRMRS